jgi:uncharacterized protein (DUF2141 family)
MKIFFIFLCLFPFIARAADVHIDITGVQAGVGQVVVSAWDSEENYLSTPFAKKTVLVTEVKGGKFRVTFSEPLPSECAINVYYDKNTNAELDTNWIGIPSEPVGITNNVKGNFGPPEYEKGKVKITGKEQIFVIHVDDI